MSESSLSNDQIERQRVIEKLREEGIKQQAKDTGMSEELIRSLRRAARNIIEEMSKTER